jgi:ABC-2 type transport system ATP-binding protein
MTILLTTHYLDEADQLAASLAIVDAGRIVAEGSPDRLKAELRGEAIHVDLATLDDASRAASLIDRLDGFDHPVLDRARLSVRAERAAASVPSVMAALEGAGIGVAAVTVARPSLDDVYFRHTGRSYQAQLQEASR